MQSVSTPIASSVALRPVLLRRASDARLARLAAGGSEAAVAEIFERHHQALHRYCFSILGNAHDAADALQNTMVKALRSLPGETRDIALRPWLYRVAHNESISLLRSRRADAELDAAAHVGDPTAGGLIESRAELRTLTQDIGELTERQRGALLMRELGGLDFPEVAQALGTSPAAVKQSVYEARCALHAMAEGRAMSCDEIRRYISDGDRRVLRGARVRGHLRDCSGCRDFELAMHGRPAQLTAMIPPLPVAAAMAILHGGLGIGGGAGGGGGGLAAGLASGAKATTGMTLAAKTAAAVAVTVTLGGAAAYKLPAVRDAGGAGRASHHVVVTPAATSRPAAVARGTSGTAAASGVTRRSAAATAVAVKRAAAVAGKNVPVDAGKPASSHGAAAPPAAHVRPATIPGHGVAAASRGKSTAAAARHKRAVTAKVTHRPATVPPQRPAGTTHTPPAVSPPSRVPSPPPAATPAQPTTPATPSAATLGAGGGRP